MLATKEQILQMESDKKVQGNTKFEINSDTIKGIKTLIKGHKINKKFPILNHLKIDVINKEVIQVSYINSEITIEKMFIANVQTIKNKSFLIPIPLFSGIKNIKKSDTFIFQEINKEVMVFTRNNLKQIVNIFDVNEFPKNEYCKMKFETLETSIGYEYFQYDDLLVLNKAILSTSNSETRPILQDVFIQDNKVYSTDSHRLFKAKTVLNSEKGLVINRNLIKKAIEVCDKNMFLKLSYSDYVLKIEDNFTTKIFARLNNGNYPQTQRLIPEDFKYEIEIDNISELFEFAKNIKGSNKLHAMKFELDVEKSLIHLEVKNEETNAEIDIPVRVKAHDLDNYKMSFSYKYLLDGLTQLDKKPVVMKIHSSMRPFIFEKQNNTNETVLILPIRTY